MISPSGSARTALSADGRLLAIAGDVVEHRDRLGPDDRAGRRSSVRRRRSDRAPGVPTGRVGCRREHRGVGDPRADRRHRRRQCWPVRAKDHSVRLRSRRTARGSSCPSGASTQRGSRCREREGSTFVDLTGVDGVNASDAVASPSGKYVGVVTASSADPLRGAHRDLGRRQRHPRGHHPARRRWRAIAVGVRAGRPRARRRRTGDDAVEPVGRATADHRSASRDAGAVGVPHRRRSRLRDGAPGRHDRRVGSRREPVDDDGRTRHHPRRCHRGA